MRRSIYYGMIGIMISGASYGTADDLMPTSKSYVDAALSTKQDLIPAQDTDKIVTYGATDGAIGSRDIVMDGDDVTTNNTGIMTVNATDPINNKQNTIINLPSSNVLSAGTDNGAVSSRHIYDSTTNRFGDGLVDASTVNTATTTALNQKFTQVDTNGNPSANGTLWRVNDVSAPLVVTSTLDASIGGQGYCCRSLNGSSNTNNGCNATILSYIGASGNKSGKWGVVFPYGDVSGISVCSDVTPPTSFKYDKASSGSYDRYNVGYVANTSESQTLTSQFNSQSGTGKLNANQLYCWCKLENPAVSSWVFRSPNVDSSRCASGCALSCANRVRNRADFRGAVFGAAAQ